MKQPFVIAGIGRSGSSFLYMVLRDHPQIALTNEAKICQLLQRTAKLCTIPSPNLVGDLRGMINTEYLPLIAEIFDHHARSILENFYTRLFSASPFTHWGDKLPNAIGTLYLKKLYPEMKVILLARDPRDVVCSFRSFALKADVTPTDRDHYTKADHAANWLHEYDLLTSLADYHLLKYSDLVEAPEQTVSKALEYLGLEMHPHCLEEIKQDRIFSFHSTSETPALSIGRWRKELSVDEAAQIVTTCGPMMERLGLARNEPRIS